MRLRHISTLVTLLCLALVLPAWAAPAFKEGTDYALQKPEIPVIATRNPNDIVVTEFFSYGCPGCATLDPHVEKWRDTKASTVEFTRIPMIFHAGWEVIAKAYYVALALGIEKQMSPLLFQSIALDQIELFTPEALADFFAAHSKIDKVTFLKTFHSPSIDIQVKQSNQYMQAYKIFSTPTFVIAGKYRTDISMTQGDPEKLINIINFLITKARSTT